MFRLIVLCLILVSKGAYADWISDHITDCKVEVNFVAKGELFRWNGQCENGKAEGNGTLTSSGGVLLVGSYHEGKPLNVTGIELFIQLSDHRRLGDSRYTNGKGHIKPIVRLDDGSLVNAISNDKILGQWLWKPTARRCQINYKFFPDGTGTTTSNQEITKFGYGIWRIENHPDVFILMTTTFESNEKRNCVGEISKATGDLGYKYLHFDESGGFSTCTSLDKKSCHGQASQLLE